MGQKRARGRANRDEVVRALVETGRVAAAARVSGRSRTTIYRWLEDPDFLQALEHTRELVVDADLDGMVEFRRLQCSAARRALELLLAVVEDESASSSARIAAANRLIGMADEAEERLARWSHERRDQLPGAHDALVRPSGTRAQAQVAGLCD